jgi:Uma2 family endonuclease
MSVASSMVVLPRPGEPENPLLRLTVEQYHAMMEQGIVREGEPFELIDGKVVCKNRAAAGEDPMTIGDRHVWSVGRLAKLDSQLVVRGCHLRTQAPLSLPPHNEPEPDGAIVRGTEDDFLDRKPIATDVLCVIEVADSSLAYDRRVKGRIYAAMGLPMYVILNLQENVAEVRRNPDIARESYDAPEILHRSDSLPLPTADGGIVAIALERMLPPVPCKPT